MIQMQNLIWMGENSFRFFKNTDKLKRIKRMKITIAATKTCNNRPLLEKELYDAGLNYTVKYFSENPEIFKKFKIKKSPLLIVDDELVSAGMPEHNVVEELKNKDKTS